MKGRDPPTVSASARVSRDGTNSTSSGPTSRSLRTNRPHATNHVQSISTANKAAVELDSPSQENGGRVSPPHSTRWGSPVHGKKDGWGADGEGWGSPTRDNTSEWGPPVTNHSERDVGRGFPANKPTTLRIPQPSVPKFKPVPAMAAPIDKPTAKPASFLPPKPAFSNPYPNLKEVTPMATSSSTAARRSSQSTPAPTPRERSASLAIALPHGFISPSPAPSVPAKPRPPTLRISERPSHSRRESLQASSTTETAPLSSISIHSNYSGFAVPIVSASPRTAGFGLDSPVSAVSASISRLKIAATPEGIQVQTGAKNVAKDPADVLWDENTELVCLALIRRRELQAAIEQVERRDKFYSTMRARHSSCTLPPSFNSPNDPLNQRVQEAQKGYEEVLTELSKRKTSWWPTPNFVDPSNVLVDLEKGLAELERGIEEVMGMTPGSRAKDLAAATTKDISMNLGEPDKRLNTASNVTPARLTPADVVHALEDLETRIEEVEGDIDAHLESSLRRNVRAYLRKRFPPAPGPAVTDKVRLETTLLRAKQAENRVQGLENRLAGLTMTSNAEQIQIVRDRIKKRREATHELIKKEESILEFLSIHNASLDVPEDKLKEILKHLTADNELISDIAKPYCARIQATIDSTGTATIPEDSQGGLRKSRRDRASDEIYEVVAGAPQMQQQLKMADWVQRNWGHIKRGEPLGMGQQSVAMDIVMG